MDNFLLWLLWTYSILSFQECLFTRKNGEYLIFFTWAKTEAEAASSSPLIEETGVGSGHKEKEIKIRRLSPPLLDFRKRIFSLPKMGGKREKTPLLCNRRRGKTWEELHNKNAELTKTKRWESAVSRRIFARRKIFISGTRGNWSQLPLVRSQHQAL